MTALAQTSGPAAIAFSGGGDSTAMLHALREREDVTHAFIIDHALRDSSAEEAVRAAEFARELGYQVAVDRWAHDGVTTGVQVKARRYRYQALGRMCRKAGLSHLITAHTADDQAETLLMRLDRQTGWRGMAGMPVSAYAPLWPALWGVTLHRPWLGVSRAALRDYNDQHGLSFTDDPSNENRDFARIRARHALAADPDLRADLLTQQKAARQRLKEERVMQGQWLARHARLDPNGFFELEAVPNPELLLHLLNIAAGQGGPIDAARRIALHDKMGQSDFKAATLAGTWVVRTPNGFVITRDKVAVAGRAEQSALGSHELTVGERELWDGRFAVQANVEGVRVNPAFGQLQILREDTVTQQIFDLPEATRPTLPIYHQGANVIGFGACATPHLLSSCLAEQRLHDLFPPSHAVPSTAV